MDRDLSSSCPTVVGEYAAQTERYVEAAVAVALGYDSDTLPILDHYLRTVPLAQQETVALVVVTAGAYFGEVLRRQLGGDWSALDGDPVHWRLILPTGISLSPCGMVAAAIARTDDIEGMDAGLRVPPALQGVVEAVFERMSQVTEEEYFSLCGRFDTITHLQAVLAGVAAEQRRRRASSEPS
ncbi:hypothetical protein [Haliangium sp.]|uniref:hypothetical protein n=1 Tax=Haliangium sp. TaxID=2663208 RepID=UPI003D1265D0